MKTSADGIDLIKHFEGCKLKAYKCPAGITSIGYGHTGDDVHDGLVWTQQQADDALQSDLDRFEKGVESLVTVPLKQCQFDALVSFAYNLGLGRLKGSTLLKMLNDGRYEGAADQLLLWVSRGTAYEKGLTLRRKAERSLFLSE